MPQEKKQRFEEGLCLYYREPIHKADGCFKKQRRHTFMTRSTLMKNHWQSKNEETQPVETVWLNKFKSQDLFLSGQPSHCFNVPFSFTCLNLQTSNINYEQDDWTLYLSLVEFVYNNIIHASTHQTPFYVNYGYHPKFDMLNKSKNENPAAIDFTIWLLKLHVLMKLHLQEAQYRYKAAVDKLIKESPSMQIDDKIWFMRRNIKTTWPCNKLDYCRLGTILIQ